MTCLALAALTPPARAEAADPERGAALYRKYCVTCHEIGAGATHTGNGPHLNGLKGQQGGTRDGYAYRNSSVQQSLIGVTYDTPDSFYLYYMMFQNNQIGFSPLKVRMTTAMRMLEGEEQSWLDIGAYILGAP